MLGDLLDNVSLMARGKVWVNNREQFHGGKFRNISLAIHQSFDHLDYLLSQIFDGNHGKNVFDTSNSLIPITKQYTYLRSNNGFFYFAQSFKGLEQMRSEEWSSDVFQERTI